MLLSFPNEHGSGCCTTVRQNEPPCAMFLQHPGQQGLPRSLTPLFPSSGGQSRRRFLCWASPYHASWPVCSAESPLWANVCFRPFTLCLATESCLQLWKVQLLHRSSQRDFNPLETCAARRTRTRCRVIPNHEFSLRSHDFHHKNEGEVKI